MQLIPAVRYPNTPKMHCIDESPDGLKSCAYERYAVCAFDNASGFNASYSFLSCMDDPWDEPLTHKKVAKCAKAVGLDWDAIASCNSTQRGDALLESASAAYVKVYPDLVYMPQASINGVSVVSPQSDDTPTYGDIKKAACTAGAVSSVC